MEEDTFESKTNAYKHRIPITIYTVYVSPMTTGFQQVSPMKDINVRLPSVGKTLLPILVLFTISISSFTEIFLKIIHFPHLSALLNNILKIINHLRILNNDILNI